MPFRIRAGEHGGMLDAPAGKSVGAQKFQKFPLESYHGCPSSTAFAAMTRAYHSPESFTARSCVS